MNDDTLIESLRELCLFLENNGIEYTLVGGLAVGIWGAPRATVDIDFLVSMRTDDYNVFKKKLKESERFSFVYDEPMTFARISFLRSTLKSNKNISVDFLFADDDFKDEALRRKETIRVAGFSVNVATPEDLIILKLLSGREQDNFDAKKILEVQRGHLDKEHIQKWANKLGIKLARDL
jgi:predicted nucleotidyltransferase